VCEYSAKYNKEGSGRKKRKALKVRSAAKEMTEDFAALQSALSAEKVHQLCFKVLEYLEMENQTDN